MGIITRLGILGLAGFGAWKLWEEYGPRVQGAVGELSDRASTATHKAADDLGKAADRATSAVKDAGTQIGRAAKDATAATDDAARTMKTGAGSSWS